MMRRGSGVLAGLALLLVLVGSIFGVWEWMQRRRFDRLSEELAAVAAEIQVSAKLGRDADGSVGLIGKPEGRYGSSIGSGTAGTGLTVTRMANWGCCGLPNDSGDPDPLYWDRATFELHLYQERHGLLGTPEIVLGSKVILHPTIMSAIDAKMKARGIGYSVVVESTPELHVLPAS
jgi:hypothetical protein